MTRKAILTAFLNIKKGITKRNKKNRQNNNISYCKKL